MVLEPEGFVHAGIISSRAVQGGNTSLRGQAESWGCADGEEKALGRAESGLAVSKGERQERRDRLFRRVCCDKKSQRLFVL